MEKKVPLLLRSARLGARKLSDSACVARIARASHKGKAHGDVALVTVSTPPRKFAGGVGYDPPHDDQELSLTLACRQSSYCRILLSRPLATFVEAPNLAPSARTVRLAGCGRLSKRKLGLLCMTAPLVVRRSPSPLYYTVHATRPEAHVRCGMHYT